MSSEAPYSELSPETVLDAIEALEFRCDGRVLALNSYESRVYQIGLEGGDPLVAKFYRPGRWSDAAIREEHAFASELARQEIPVVAPLTPQGESPHIHQGLRCCLSAPWRALARNSALAMNANGWARSSTHPCGPRRTIQRARAFEWKISGAMPAISCSTAIDAGLPRHQIRGRHRPAAGSGGNALPELTARCAGRILSDCHRGNILWTDLGPHFVDLDDCLTGPAVQDVWMLLSEGAQEMRTSCMIYLGATSNSSHLIAARCTDRAPCAPCA